MKLSKHEFIIDASRYSILVPDMETLKNSYTQIKHINKKTPFPYWGKVWPAAKAMQKFITNEGKPLIKNKKIIEIGCGIGLPSFTASIFADSVLMTDYNTDALEHIQMNIKYWHTNNIEISLFDWRKNYIEDDFDVLIMSDLNYEAESHQDLIFLIESFLIIEERKILLSTPDRIIGGSFINKISSLVVSKKQYEIDKTNCFVYILQKKNRTLIKCDLTIIF